MKLPTVVATDAVVRSIELAQVQASRRVAMGPQPLISQMPLQQAITVTSLGGQSTRAVFGVVGVARYEAVGKL
ncbi:hypothetical protein [Pelomonas sp. Root1217]|uniref:hypothetical protein n=1 Tax=Pelomonas sp. Root1217 TaxID=1736430 RepID=UPI0012FB357E|nr:hypothetical protein [Pelomonas sp. Root1217]